MTTMEQTIAAALEKSGRDPMRPVCIDPSPLPDIRFRMPENRGLPGPRDSTTGNRAASSTATGGSPPSRSATTCRWFTALASATPAP